MKEPGALIVDSPEVGRRKRRQPVVAAGAPKTDRKDCRWVFLSTCSCCREGMSRKRKGSPEDVQLEVAGAAVGGEAGARVFADVS